MRRQNPPFSRGEWGEGKDRTKGGGGGDVDDAFKVMIEKANGGDFVVFRASGGAGYNDYLYEMSYQINKPLNSVQTFVFTSAEAAKDPAVLRAIRNAEAIFFAGGDQAKYVNYWSDNAIEAELNNAIKRNVPIGGTYQVS